jgi:hypothetical protein
MKQSGINMKQKQVLYRSGTIHFVKLETWNKKKYYSEAELFISWNLKPETWNLKQKKSTTAKRNYSFPETWNLKPETWNLKQKISTTAKRNYSFRETWNLKLETWNEKSPNDYISSIW